LLAPIRWPPPAASDHEINPPAAAAGADKAGAPFGNRRLGAVASGQFAGVRFDLTAAVLAEYDLRDRGGIG
jgi:hypothetical protein